MILYLPFSRGICVTPWLIIIPTSQKNDRTCLVHEETHAYQQKLFGVFVFWYKYLTDKTFREISEVSAYKEQIAAGKSLEWCAQNLSNGYRLNLSYSEAVKLLS